MPDHILKHLHPYTHNKETKRIGIAESPEFDKITIQLQKWLYNFFPVTADEDGISRWEDFLDLGHGGENDTLEDRRERVILKLNERLPYTIPRLYQMLASLCGWEGFTFSLAGAQLSEVHIRINWYGEVLMSTVMEMLERVLPLNLHFDCLFIYTCEPAVVTQGKYMFTTEIITTPKYVEHITANVNTAIGTITTEIITTPVSDLIVNSKHSRFLVAKQYSAVGAQITDIITTPLYLYDEDNPHEEG